MFAFVSRSSPHSLDVVRLLSRIVLLVLLSGPLLLPAQSTAAPTARPVYPLQHAHPSAQLTSAAVSMPPPASNATSATCALYPIALQSQTLRNIAPNAIISNILNGVGVC